MTARAVLSAVVVAVLSCATAQIDLPFPDDLSPTCSKTLCDTFKLLGTCPVFGLNWPSVCADYFVGFLFQCPGYPGKDDIYDAPSVCMEDYVSVVMALNASVRVFNTKEVASGNFSEYCQTGCYQQYLTTVNDYNQNCPQGNLSKLLFPLVSFRGIACGSTNATAPAEDKNCYDALTKKTSLAVPGAYSPASDFTCAVLSAPQYQGGVCPSLYTDGCCNGNQAVILAQTIRKPYPPCLMKYCKNIAPVNALCGKHINYGTGNIQGYVYLDFAPPKLPYMYNSSAVLQFQAYLTAPIAKLGGGSLNALQAAIIDFTYFDENGTPITVNTPVAYKTAKSGNFTFLLTRVGVTELELAQTYAAVASPYYDLGLAKAFNLSSSTPTPKASVWTSRYYEANPIIVASSAQSIFLPSIWLALLSIFSALIFGVML